LPPILSLGRASFFSFESVSYFVFSPIPPEPPQHRKEEGRLPFFPLVSHCPSLDLCGGIEPFSPFSSLGEETPALYFHQNRCVAMIGLPLNMVAPSFPSGRLFPCRRRTPLRNAPSSPSRPNPPLKCILIFAPLPSFFFFRT